MASDKSNKQNRLIMKKSLLVMLAATSFMGFAGHAMAADSPVAYLGSTAGGSAYGSAFSSENAKAEAGASGGYESSSFASQNAGKHNDYYGMPSIMSIGEGRGCMNDVQGCSAGTVTTTAGMFKGRIGDDSGVVSGYTGGESLASVAKVGADMTVATAEHQSAASMATSGAGTTGIAVNEGYAVSHYSDLANGSAITAAY
jgi:hypothetical protein